MPWYRFLTDLGDRGGDTAISSIRRAALEIRAEKSLLPEQKRMCGELHARPRGDTFIERTST